MVKAKRITPDTSYNQIYERFVNKTLLKSDYSFIGGMFRAFRDNIVFIILKARINSDIQTILRTPKQSSESAKEMGHLEGLDACLSIIDQLAKFDEQIPREQEEAEETTLDQQPIVPYDTNAGIESY